MYTIKIVKLRIGHLQMTFLVHEQNETAQELNRTLRRRQERSDAHENDINCA